MVSVARALGLLAKRSSVAVDATGLYYVWRLGGRHSRLAYPGLTVACDLASHLWLGAVVSMGPSQDSYATDERQYAKALYGSIPANCLVLMDRAYLDAAVSMNCPRRIGTGSRQRNRRRHGG